MTWHDMMLHDVTWHGVTWCDMTWHDVKWRNMTWHGATWHDMTWRDMTWHDVTWRDMTWHGATWHGVTWRDVTGPDVTWRDMTWHDVTWRDVTWRDVTWYDMTWHDMTWHDMTWHDMTWHDMTWHDMTWHDMTWHDVAWRDITWHHVTSRDVTWHHVTWRNMMSHAVTWRHMTSHYGTWRHMKLNAHRCGNGASDWAVVGRVWRRHEARTVASQWGISDWKTRCRCSNQSGCELRLVPGRAQPHPSMFVAQCEVVEYGSNTMRRHRRVEEVTRIGLDIAKRNSTRLKHIKTVTVAFSQQQLWKFFASSTENSRSIQLFCTIHQTLNNQHNTSLSWLLVDKLVKIYFPWELFLYFFVAFTETVNEYIETE